MKTMGKNQIFPLVHSLSQLERRKWFGQTTSLQPSILPLRVGGRLKKVVQFIWKVFKVSVCKQKLSVYQYFREGDEKQNVEGKNEESDSPARSRNISRGAGQAALHSKTASLLLQVAPPLPPLLRLPPPDRPSSPRPSPQRCSACPASPTPQSWAHQSV